jgi:hypothetical protein
MSMTKTIIPNKDISVTFERYVQVGFSTPVHIYAESQLASK